MHALLGWHFFFGKFFKVRLNFFLTKFNSLLIARNHFLIHKMQKVSINLFIIIKPFIDMNQDPSKMIVLEEKIIVSPFSTKTSG